MDGAKNLTVFGSLQLIVCELENTLDKPRTHRKGDMQNAGKVNSNVPDRTMDTLLKSSREGNLQGR